MRISDWSSDVCSSDLVEEHAPGGRLDRRVEMRTIGEHDLRCLTAEFETDALQVAFAGIDHQLAPDRARAGEGDHIDLHVPGERLAGGIAEPRDHIAHARGSSEEHTSDLQPLMRISYALFFL